MTTLPVAAPGRPWKLALIARDIKLAHSVFALPFAVLAAFLAWAGSGRSPARFAGQLALVVACMVTARTWAMVVNRLLDARLDAANPRTSRRLFASGRARARDGWLVAAGSAALFVACAGAFWALFANPWPTVGALPVLAWIAFYSLTKRFTSLCHLVLGVSLALSPIAAAIAVRPEALAQAPALWLLAGMVLVWVAGFDVIYALQDLDFDRAHGVRSIPARLGPGGALWASRILHALALAALFGAWRVEPRFGWLFGAGVAAVGGLLIAEHLVLVRRGRAGLEMAFFTLNGVISCVLGLAGCVDTLV